VLLFATMAFHAFFGVALIMGTAVLQPQYFSQVGRTWGGSLLSDQQFGGALAWGIGEVPTLVLALIVAVQWARTDEREARRLDRAADRDGDAELTAYNEMLGRLADRGRRSPR
jgi:putative copper resistance protein D